MNWVELILMAKQMPRAVADKVLARCAKDEPVVVVPKNGKPSRVFSLEKYLKMKEQPKKHKPWRHRKQKDEVPDPLGTAHWNARILMPLDREHIYDMDED